MSVWGLEKWGAGISTITKKHSILQPMAASFQLPTYGRRSEDVAVMGATRPLCYNICEQSCKREFKILFLVINICLPSVNIGSSAGFAHKEKPSQDFLCSVFCKQKLFLNIFHSLQGLGGLNFSHFLTCVCVSVNQGMNHFTFKWRVGKIFVLDGISCDLKCFMHGFSIT